MTIPESLQVTRVNAKQPGLLPDAMYRCEGADDFAPEALYGSHYRDDEGGYLPPDQLFHAMVEDQTSQWNGFWCRDCISRMNITLEENPLTLKAALQNSRAERLARSLAPIIYEN